MEGCRCIFQQLDVDGSGTISSVEVQNLLHMLGFAAGSQEVVRLVKEIDRDGSGEIDFEEFLSVGVLLSFHPAPSCIWQQLATLGVLQVMSGLSRPSYSKWQLQHAFRLLSTEQAPPHHISRAALQHHLVRQV